MNPLSEAAFENTLVSVYVRPIIAGVRVLIVSSTERTASFKVINLAHVQNISWCVDKMATEFEKPDKIFCSVYTLELLRCCHHIPQEAVNCWLHHVTEQMQNANTESENPQVVAK